MTRAGADEQISRVGGQAPDVESPPPQARFAMEPSTLDSRVSSRGSRRPTTPRLRRLWYLALIPVALVAVLFSLWEWIRLAFFRDIDPELMYKGYLVRDIIGAGCTTFFAVWLVLRERERTEAALARERERQEAERVRTASLAAVGELAAAVAHEVRNPLQGIAAAVDILSRRFQPGDAEREMAIEVTRQVRRLDATVRDLLVFARPQVPEKRRVEIGPLIERIHSVLREEPDMARVDLEVDVPEGFAVAADGAMLEQVFFNLILNSAQAMPEGGKVTIQARRRGREVEITVADTGKGIPEKIRSEIFKPFFTTKHKGTGLGLAIVRKVIEAHGGRIAVESEEGVGTAIAMTLPDPRAAVLAAPEGHEP
jgi:signal transduction histidine kinase